MAYVIAYLNEKGGEGKTVSALNTSTQLSNKGYRVLFIEIDPQGNSLSYFKGDAERTTLEEMFTNTDKAEAYPTQYPGLDYIPTTKNFAIVPSFLEKVDGDQTLVLSNVLKPLKEDYDFIIIDCLPTLNLLTTNVLRIADEVITPMTISDEGLQGLKSTYQNIVQMYNYFDSQIQHRVLFTKVSLRSKDERYVMDQICQSFDCYEQTIRYQRKPMRDSSFKKKMVVNSNAKTNMVGLDYRNLVEEILERKNA